jgi:hypothetical protein
MFPYGFISSVHNLILIFLGSLAKSLCFMSMPVHSGESMGCLSIPSYFLHYACHNNNLASFGFEKRRRNLGSIDKYQITFALASFILSISSSFCLYLEALHFNHFFKSLCTPRNNIQSFGQT